VALLVENGFSLSNTAVLSSLGRYVNNVAEEGGGLVARVTCECQVPLSEVEVTVAGVVSLNNSMGTWVTLWSLLMVSNPRKSFCSSALLFGRSYAR
jgi:hypothetical protein